MSASAALTATTVPLTGAKRSETDLVDSTSPTAVARLDVGALVGELDEHDVAELGLRVIGDADADHAVAEVADPLVGVGVAQVVGDHGGSLAGASARCARGVRRASTIWAR